MSEHSITTSGLQAWGKLLDTFFSVEDQAAIEWCIGAIIAGGPKKILVFYGPAASGKSTTQKLIRGIVEHCVEECSLRVAIRPDGLYGITNDAFMIATENESAMERGKRVTSRLIEVRTTGEKLPNSTYHTLTGLVDSDRGTIGTHCLGTYRDFGPKYYDNKENDK